MIGSFVDVWHGDILSKEQEEQSYEIFLSESEKQKAATYTRSELQKKYIKTRGVLRKILSDYLETEPQNIIINTGEYGKPYLETDFLYFNLSHTGNRFVVVVSNLGEVGVDIELHRQRKNLSALASKCFSDEEIAYWSSLSEEDKIRMFFRFWVRKEAFVKAVGRGIALGLNQCIIDPKNQTCFLEIPEKYGLAADWKILDISLNKDDICAVVTKNKNFEYKQMAL